MLELEQGVAVCAHLQRAVFSPDMQQLELYLELQIVTKDHHLLH